MNCDYTFMNTEQIMSQSKIDGDWFVCWFARFYPVYYLEPIRFDNDCPSSFVRNSKTCVHAQQLMMQSRKY